MISVLSEHEVKSMSEKLEELEDTLAKNLHSDIENRKNFRELNEEKILVQSELQSLEKKGRELQDTINTTATHNKKLSTQIDNIKQATKSNARNIDILNTMDKRPSFYDALADRLNRINEEFIDSGIEFKSTEVFVDEIKAQIEGGGISDYLVFVRGGKGKYDTMIENIATKMVDQNPVSPKELLNINDYLDRFLKHDTIVARWN